MNVSEFQNQTAIVTGGSSGIGAAVARHFVERGATVFSLDLQEPVEEMPRGVEHIGCDVSDEAQVTAAIAKVAQAVPKVEILINNAGVAGPYQAPLWELNLDYWRRINRINVEGVFLVCRSVIPIMLEGGYGRIVNVASMAGMEGNARSSAYAASKAAVIAMTKSMGKELATTGVLVNAVTPTVFETPLNGKVDSDYHDFLVGRIPLGRMGDVREAAEMIGFLSSSRCSFSTGAIFDLSGGRAVY